MTASWHAPTRPVVRRGTPDLLVPAYFHPAVAAQAWERLAEPGQRLRLVVVNVNSGPGDVIDPSYVPVVTALRDARVRLAGYIDTDYGRRPVDEVVADVVAYRQHYQVSGVFLDQVSSGSAELDLYARYVLAARTAGASFVVLNPGVHPHPGYVDLADLTVTFEGPWAAYRNLDVPAWVHERPARRFCHLIHSVPPDASDRVLDLAFRRNAGTAFVTDGRGVNPWDRYPGAPTTAMARPAATVSAP